MRSSTRRSAIQTIRALSMIPAITGNIDVPGGWIFGMKGAGRFPSLIENLDPEVEKKRLGYEKYKMLCGEGADLPACHIPSLIDSMLYGKPYRTRAFLVFGKNTLTTYANTNMATRRCLKLDFMVCADLVHDAHGRARRHRAARRVMAQAQPDLRAADDRGQRRHEQSERSSAWASASPMRRFSSSSRAA